MKKYTISKDAVMKGAQAETTLVAMSMRQAGKDGQEIDPYDLVVMDGGADLMLMRWMEMAAADMVTELPAMCIEHAQVVDDTRDIEVMLVEPREWVRSAAVAMGTALESYVVNYVVWQWLLFKMPDVAGAYAERYQKSKEQVILLLHKRNEPLRRRNQFAY